MRPSQSFITLIFTLAIVALLAGVGQSFKLPEATILLKICQASLLILAVVALIDAMRARTYRPIHIERQMPNQASVGLPFEIHYTIKHRLKSPATVLVFDGFPIDWQREHEPLQIKLSPKHTSQMTQTVTPNQRGMTHFQGCQSLISSPWHLWEKHFDHDLDGNIKIMPDFSKIIGADLLSLNKWLQMIGVKRSYRLGASLNFHQLRDFQQSDDIRHIDWKASSRHQRLICRTFEAEHDQQLIFLLDCGRSMRIVDNELTHFDYTLNAVMLLSYAALRHQDAVGLMTMAHESPRFLPAKKNSRQINQILETVYDIDPSQQVPDYAKAVDRILKQQHRRSLVVVITHIEQNNDPDLLLQLSLLNKHHSVVVANLQQHQQQQALNVDIQHTDDANLYMGAQMYQFSQQKLIEDMQKHKLAYLNVLPQELNAALINHYLNLKQHGSW